jgi:RHS repeat-associated protein
LPDGTFYKFGYEKLANGNTTGRVVSVKLPAGGTISYGYSGSNGGIDCKTGAPITLTRTTPDGPWTYNRTIQLDSNGNVVASTTKITDPQANQTVVRFTGNFETQRQVYSGTASGTPIENVITCYNGTSPPSTCATATSGFPSSEVSVYRSLNGGPFSRVDTFLNTYGLPTERDEYDYGATTPTRKTSITYASVSNGVKDRPSIVKTTDGTGNFVQETDYIYDEDINSLKASGAAQLFAPGCPSAPCRGNVTTVKTYVTPSTFLTKKFAHYDTGQVYTATDTNAAVTTYTYGDCGNSLLTNVSLPLGLSTSQTSNCTGAVVTSSTDANLQPTNTTYTNPDFWRPASITDPTGAAASICYGILSGGNCVPNANQVETVLTNSVSSAVDTLRMIDSLGRPSLAQSRQAPGSTNFDTTTVFYDSDGRPFRGTVPCVQTAGQPCPTTPSTTTTYDGAGRPSQTADGGGGTTTYIYSQNDVLQKVGPAPGGENLKQKQVEYDALGRITSVCEILATGGSSCGQKSAASGYLTSRSYTVPTTGGSSVVVTQGAQQRTYIYDALGRLLSETNPETNNIATTYKYDTDAACNLSALGLSSTSNGDLISMTDANGNKTCYTYDSLHRVTDIVVLKNNACYPPVKRLRYDNTSGKVLPFPTGYSATNAGGRMVEAWTGDCVWPTPSSGSDSATDEWFAYSARGEMTDSWESTSHVLGYFHGLASYAANGALASLGGVPGYTTITYGLDAEGRPNTATQGSTNLVTGVTYTAAGQPKSVTLGAGDSDAYGYDSSTGRMTSYTFTVNGASDSGALTWNPNGSLGKLVITDQFNAGGSQTCKYGDQSAAPPVLGYDDLGRLISDNCGSVWSQTFSYDQYGNITKSGSSSWMPGYDPRTNHAMPPFTYDNNGNMTNDTFHTYGWYVDNKLGSTDSTTCNIFGSTNGTCILYDAFGREVERGVNGVYTEVMYTPVGKTAIMNGETTTVSAYFPLPGGGTYFQSGSTGANGYFWHKDWLGSVRLSSSITNRTPYFDRAFAPFGESYNNFGNAAGLDFTGDTQDSFAGLLYDTPGRELHPGQGRWLSPDPAGLGAVDPTNPQSWNRYAYVFNNPLILIDPTGLWCVWEDGTHDKDEFNGGFNASDCAKEGGHWDPFDTIMGIFQDGNGNITQINYIGGGICTTADCGAGGTLEQFDQTLQGYSRLPSDAANNGFTIGIRAPGQTYSQCLAGNTGNYSIAGVFNIQNSVGKFFGGNDVGNLLFGDASEGQAGLILTHGGATAVSGGVGTAGTFGRRTASIFDLNLSGTTGPAPTILGKTGAEEVAGVLSGIAEIKFAIDVGLTGAEAIGCAFHR